MRDLSTIFRIRYIMESLKLDSSMDMACRSTLISKFGLLGHSLWVKRLGILRYRKRRRITRGIYSMGYITGGENLLQKKLYILELFRVEKNMDTEKSLTLNLA